MLDLAAWKGLVGPPLSHLPAIAYFHENQFSYPVVDPVTAQRDAHLAYSNFLTAVSADAVLFNSQYHLDAMISDAASWLSRMPDYSHADQLQAIREKSFVEPPGIGVISDTKEPHSEQPRQTDSAPTVGWVMRWEHDKAPELFADAIAQLVRNKVPFRLCLLGERFAKQHESLERVRSVAGDRIIYDAYAPTSQEYLEQLRNIDIVVSTAKHEFFGIAIAEAILAGAQPLLPNRLAYPEILELERFTSRSELFYESDSDFYPALKQSIDSFSQFGPSKELVKLRARLKKHHWPQRAKSLDDRVSQVCD